MPQRTTIPEDNLLVFNHVGGNLATGIYSDGGARNVISGNRIDGNSKEGICLDNGATSNVVALNTFEGNGQRWGKTDDDLRPGLYLFSRPPAGRQFSG